ncbi:MAG TPA: carbohydrate binding domain-containing protein, partial [Limnochordia bacterium]|nr:carbohydrate binding domain-containing protein [Limnochordia bacterium]
SSINKFRKSLYLLVLVLVFSLAVGCAQDKPADESDAVEPQSAYVYQEDFAGGQLNGWASANADVQISSAFAKSDQYSVQVTTRGEGWNRLEYNFAGMLQAGKTYEFTVWLYHEFGENLEFHLARKLGDNFMWLGGNEIIPNKQWTQITNTYTVEDHTSEWLFFVEVYKEGVVYYADDISVRLVE